MGEKIKTKLSDSKDELSSLMAARMFTYNLFKRAFIEEPSRSFLEFLLSFNLNKDFLFLDENTQINKGVELISHFINQQGVMSEESRTDLEVDYTHLFIGPGIPAAPPWESFYLSEKKLLFQDETIKVRREYDKYNLRVEKFQKEPDDLIAFELDFMNLLAQKTLESLDRDDFLEAEKLLGAQRDFLKGHLLKWIPQFSKNVVKDAETDFYKGFAQALAGFLKTDYNWINALLK
ncbi:MAG: molecular chaperone TorD family protein [Actinobacteria bacterium]|nr:molecular chaperone TorD family protein [Actinomycetota bacterium]